MKKNVTQDIVPARKSIRDIEVPSRSKGEIKKVSRQDKDDPFTRPVAIKTPPVTNFDQIEEEDQPIKIQSTGKMPPPPPVSPYKFEYHEPKKSSKKYLYIGILCAVLVGLFFISSMFKSATVTVTPLVQTKPLNESFVAKKDITSNALSYQVVTVTKDVQKTIDSKDITSEKKVERKAKGIIVIYNNFGAAPQKLIATTRFETPEGLIFRLSNPVTVPGKYTKDGKSLPGSVEAEVVADLAGASYNVGLKDFTVPGLKSDPAKYKAIYARSKTEMTGGYSGMEKVISNDVLVKVSAELQDSLKTALSKDIASQIPGDFVLFQNSLTYKFEPASTMTGADGVTAAKMKGVVNAIIFDKKVLTKAVLSKILPDSNSDLIKITNLDSLEFNSQSGSTTSNAGGSITFTLKGDANLVWVIDDVKLKNDLLGLSKNNANTVMSAYPSIKEAWVLTRPFWNTKIPSDPKKVTVVNTFTK